MPDAPQAGEDEEAEAPPPPKGTLARLGELAWQALPAIGSALGLAGFVALIGGAIEWIRFWAAGLPPDQAVGAVSNQELVTIGAVSLILFMIVGVLVVLAVYLLDRDGDVTIPTLHGLVVLAVAEMLITLIFVDVHVYWYPIIIVWLLGLGLLGFRVLAGVPVRLHGRDDFREADDELRAALRVYRDAEDAFDDAFYAIGRIPPDDNAGPDHPDPQMAKAKQAEWERDLARHRWVRAVRRWMEQDKLLNPADSTRRRKMQTWRQTHHIPSEAEFREALSRRSARKPVFKRLRRLLDRDTSILVALLAAGALALYLFDDTRWLAVMLLVVILLALGLFGVARATGRFAW